MYCVSLLRGLLRKTLPLLPTAHQTAQLHALLGRSPEPFATGAKPKQKQRAKRGSQTAPGDDGSMCGVNLAVTINFEHELELTLGGTGVTKTIYFTHSPRTLQDHQPPQQYSLDAVAVSALAAGAQVRARVTGANITAGLRAALINFITDDFLVAGRTTGVLDVSSCTGGFFRVKLLSRTLVGTVIAADGQHNHQSTVNPGHGTTSTAALHVDWTELAARHRAGTDLTTIIVELSRRGVYPEYNQLRHILRCESRLATQAELATLGATRAEVAVFSSGTSKDKQKKMWIRHKYSDVVVVAERRYPKNGDKPAFLQRFLKLPAHPMHQSTGSDGGGDDAVILLDITNLDRSVAVGPSAS